MGRYTLIKHFPHRCCNLLQVWAKSWEMKQEIHMYGITLPQMEVTIIQYMHWSFYYPCKRLGSRDVGLAVCWVCPIYNNISQQLLS